MAKDDDQDAASGATPEVSFAEAVGHLGPTLLSGLQVMEGALRQMHPPRIEALRESLRPVLPRLEARRLALESASAPPDLENFAASLGRSAEHAERAFRLFLGESEDGPQGPLAMLEAMRAHARAQAALFPLRATLPPVDAAFIEPGFEARLPVLAQGARGKTPVGLFNARNDASERGGFTLYVPEDYSDDRVWPMVVTLHGGMGHGDDFIWSWIRSARARGWLVLSPTSQESTWSLYHPARDGRALDAMVDYVCGRWQVDPKRMLLTGLSDGATFSLLHGLSERPRPFSFLAPVAGVLHPQVMAGGSRSNPVTPSIRWIHGALDWMFPVEVAREAVRILQEAGQSVIFEEIADLSHTWPRECTGPLLEWAAAGQA
ncbi:MAG: PHB depolymerase family esterase [Myxococcota bacterium]|nr:PHB depolymerase family esterase [Myxococcota bacterium]